MRSSWAPLASVGVHGLLAVVALRVPIEPPERDELEALAFELIEVPPREETEPPPPIPAIPSPEEASAPPPTRPAAVRRTPRATSVELVEPGSAALETEPDALAPEPAGPPAEPTGPAPRVLTRAEQRRLIDPTLAIPGLYVPTGPGPSRRGPPAGLVLEENRPTEQELEAQHGGFLRQRAMARAWLSRSEPELRRQPDGSYLYDGHAFTARIRPDGSVDFEARDNIRIEGPDLQNIPFDIDNMIHDVYSYERQRFMDHTEALRDRLEAEHRAQTDTDGLRVLPGRLAGIWRQTTRSAAARRRRIFELWDQMADDETGRRARAIVTGWVREHLPVGSDDAYPDAELARLNARRESASPFAPY